MAGVEEDFYRALFVFCDFDGFDMAHFYMVGNGRHGAFVGLKNGDRYLGITREDSTAPATGPESADWCQSQQWRVHRQNWSVGGKISR